MVIRAICLCYCYSLFLFQGFAKSDNECSVRLKWPHNHDRMSSRDWWFAILCSGTSPLLRPYLQNFCNSLEKDPTSWASTLLAFSQATTTSPLDLSVISIILLISQWIPTCFYPSILGCVPHQLALPKTTKLMDRALLRKSTMTFKKFTPQTK